MHSDVHRSADFSPGTVESSTRCGFNGLRCRSNPAPPSSSFCRTRGPPRVRRAAHRAALSVLGSIFMPTSSPRHVEVFDTTLRDGLQVEGVSATVDDKLRIAEQLDLLGVHFIEGGWPGANPKDIEFFARAQNELHLTTSTLVAFGSTRRPRGKVDDDATLRNLIEANTAAGVHRGQELRISGRRDAPDDARRGRRDDRRLGEVPPRRRPDGARRPRALLRRVQGQSRVLAACARSCSREWRVASGAVRHQRRHAAERDRSNRRRRQGPCRQRRDHRHPLSRRHRLRRGQLDGGGRGGCRPCAGNAQRPRRANRQHQPHDGHPEPATQARLPVSAGGSHRAAHRR